MHMAALHMQHPLSHPGVGEGIPHVPIHMLTGIFMPSTINLTLDQTTHPLILSDLVECATLRLGVHSTIARSLHFINYPYLLIETRREQI